MAWNPKSAKVRTFRPTVTHIVRGRTISFDFEDELDGIGRYAPSVTDSQRRAFEQLFYKEIENIETWAESVGWPLASDFPTIHIHVSGIYRLARSLVLHWENDRGRMEFPAYRVAVEEAPVLHELTHVYFPNSNRFLAEGIAVYMQHEHGTSIAYPDFGTDLDLILKEEFGSLLGQLQLAKLDQITTPMNLLLRVGRQKLKEELTYVVSGSFVRFLLHQYPIEKFRELYALTPLIPFERDCGDPDRWTDVYGESLPQLQARWLSYLEDATPSGDSEK
jgi:hypothetical protein